jgi:type IV pilus biogenesis protein CpaD/CtpE
LTFAHHAKSAGLAGLVALMAVLMALGLSGCGRRSDLQTPGVPAAAATGTPSSVSTGSVIDSTGQQTKSTTRVIAPKRDFLLDPLL